MRGNAPAPAPAPPPVTAAPRGTVARAPLALRQAPPRDASSWTQHAQTSAEALAAATGATISRTEDGFAAVSFDAPAPAPHPAAGPTLSRAVTFDEVSVAPATQEPTRTATTQPAAGQQPAAPAASTDKDELYEYVVDRLKRDLFAEQEQAGIGPTLL